MSISESFVEQIFDDEERTIEIPGHLGKPLTAAKLRKNCKNEESPALYMCFMVEKLDLEYKPKKPFDELRKELIPIGDAIFKRIIKEGYGEGYGDTVKENARVTVKYTLYFEGDESIPNSTAIFKKPFTFSLGNECGILPGFEIAVKSMRNQEKSEFIIPSNLLYGDDGYPPHVESNLDGYITIAVTNVVDTMAKKDKLQLLSNFDLTMKKVLQLRQEAKDAFAAEFYHVAMDLYIEAGNLLLTILVHTEEDNMKRLEQLLAIFVYTGMCFNKIDQPLDAAHLFMNAVEFEKDGAPICDSLRGKLYIHAARAYGQLYMIPDAYQFYRKAHDTLGNTEAVQNEFKMICQAKKVHNTYLHMLSDEVSKSARRPATPENCVKPELFRALFEQILSTFACSKDKKMVLYAMTCYGLKESLATAKKYKKIFIEVQNESTLFVSIHLTKKEVHSSS